MRLVRPVFCSINYTEFSKNYLKLCYHTNRHIMVIKDFNEDGSIKGSVIKATADKKGRLCIGTDPAPLLPGKYHFYISDDEVENINKITKEHCTDAIDITDQYEQLIDLPVNYIQMDESDSKGRPMIVRTYGSGLDTAIFFIGGLHGDELGGMWSIEIMEKFIEADQSQIPPSVKLFFLNPVHDLGQLQMNPKEAEKKFKLDGYRYINEIDPNRDFFNKKLPETRNIIELTKSLCNNYADVIIISAHSAYDPKVNGVSRNGVVFPNYKLTPSGRQKVEKEIKMKGTYKDGLVLSSGDYNNPDKSNKLALMFEKETSYKYTPLWLSTIYEGEYMNYIDRLEKDITMIEFENRKEFSYDFIVEKWKARYEGFILNIFGEYHEVI